MEDLKQIMTMIDDIRFRLDRVTDFNEETRLMKKLEDLLIKLDYHNMLKNG